MTAATHWTVIAVLGDGRGHGTCGHVHATADEATLCPWTPDLGYAAEHHGDVEPVCSTCHHRREEMRRG